MESRIRKACRPGRDRQIVYELVRHDTTNPPGNEHLCKEIVTVVMTSLGMDISYYEKEPGRTNVVGRIGKGRSR